ncbi:MAG: YbaK/EbsC family protein [Phycisphaerae bacterium]|jgi:Ala-tRNA(Pro) deacylase|nr:YbaK/EbsC family protein [Phycisphaerae bacterium]
MNVKDYLSQQGVSFEVHEHAPAYTAQEVASEEHVSGNVLAKAVVVHAGEAYAMCVLPASYKLDLNEAAKALGVTEVRLADESELAELFPDAEVGAAAPIGKLHDLPTVVDRHLATDDEVVFQAGTHREVIRMTYSDYEKLAEPSVADIAVHL